MSPAVEILVGYLTLPIVASFLLVGVLVLRERRDPLERQYRMRAVVPPHEQKDRVR